jgi:hypothetical protein
VRNLRLPDQSYVIASSLFDFQKRLPTGFNSAAWHWYFETAMEDTCE